jgi:hypothetical protein
MSGARSMKRYFLEMFFGFVAAVVLALGPPIAFLAIPAAGFFLFVVPIWSIGVVGLLFFGLLIFGRIPAAIGVGILVLAVALSPLGRATMALVDQTNKRPNANDVLQQKRKECATTGYTPLKKPSAKHDLIVLKNIERCGTQNYDIADTVAVLTGMRVVEIGRVCFDTRSSETWETMAAHSDSCVGEHDSAKVGATPHLLPKSIAPLAVDVCLRRAKIPDPSGDRTPAIVLRAIPFGGDCQATEVVERTQSGDVELGRVHYDFFHERYYPDLPLPEGVPQNNWLVVLLSEVLQQDLSDKALMGHAVKAEK